MLTQGQGTCGSIPLLQDWSTACLGPSAIANSSWQYCCADRSSASLEHTNNPPRGDRSAGFYIICSIFDWILIDSVLKLLLYGTRFRINYCPPGNIGNWSLQHSPESWKYWKSEFLTSSYPGNIGKRIFSTSSYPGNSGSYDPYSVLSWKYWIVRSIYQSYPGNIGSYDPQSVLSWK